MKERESVFAAFHSAPDYSAGNPPLVGVYKTLDGAIHALYPDNEQHRAAFREWEQGGVWEGPDGFGLVRRIEVGE